MTKNLDEQTQDLVENLRNRTADDHYRESTRVLWAEAADQLAARRTSATSGRKLGVALREYRALVIQWRAQRM